MSRRCLFELDHVNIASARSDVDGDVVGIFTNVHIALFRPWRNNAILPSMERKPNNAGTSLCSNTDPLYVKLPSSDTPYGTIAFVATAFDEPPTPHTLPNPACASTVGFLPAAPACVVTRFNR